MVGVMGSFINKTPWGWLLRCVLSTGYVDAHGSFYPLSRKLSTLQRLAIEKLDFPCSLEVKVLDMNVVPLQRALVQNVESRHGAEKPPSCPRGCFAAGQHSDGTPEVSVTALQGPLSSSVTGFHWYSPIHSTNIP